MSAIGDCSGEACLLPPGSLPYGATPAGNAFMLAAFAALIPPVIYAGIRYRTLAHTSFLLAALAFEVIGHVGKIFLVANPTSHAYSALYLMGTHWGAILIGSAVNLVLPHTMVIYGDEFRLVSDPVHLNILFFILDIFALAFQSVGIGFASTAHTSAEVSQGGSILLTGLAIQAVNLLAFIGTYRYFRRKLSHRRYILDDTHALVYSSRRFTYFMIGTQVVAALLLLRTAVRIAIFAAGLDSTFSTSQVTTFLLDDTPILIALLILGICPPGRAFGAAWAPTSPLAGSPDRPNNNNNTLPLRLRRHRRNRSSRINKRVISLPYTSPSTSPRFSPGGGYTYTPRGGMTPGLPAHPSPRGNGAPGPPLTSSSSPLMSPRNHPVHHQRAPYELSPTQEVPYMAPEESPGLDSALWMASPKMELGRKRRVRAGSGPGAEQMVEGDALWS